jgi:hypothetical protein
MGWRNLRRIGMEGEEFMGLDRASNPIILGAVDASSRPVAAAPRPESFNRAWVFAALPGP